MGEVQQREELLVADCDPRWCVDVGVHQTRKREAARAGGRGVARSRGAYLGDAAVAQHDALVLAAFDAGLDHREPGQDRVFSCRDLESGRREPGDDQHESKQDACGESQCDAADLHGASRVNASRRRRASSPRTRARVGSSSRRGQVAFASPMPCMAWKSRLM